MVTGRPQQDAAPTLVEFTVLWQVGMLLGAGLQPRYMSGGQFVNDTLQQGSSSMII
jgi:hypothetical protein